MNKTSLFICMLFIVGYFAWSCSQNSTSTPTTTAGSLRAVLSGGSCNVVFELDGGNPVTETGSFVGTIYASVSNGTHSLLMVSSGPTTTNCSFVMSGTQMQIVASGVCANGPSVVCP